MPCGDRPATNEFVPVMRLADGTIREVWNYNWDQRALAAIMPAAA